MKIRTGFVSNSSSSSFLLLITKEAHDKILENSNEVNKILINHIMGEPFNLAGQEFLGMSTMSGNCASDFDPFEDLDLDKIEEAKKILSKDYLEFLEEEGLGSFYYECVEPDYVNAAEKLIPEGKAYTHSEYF